MTEKPKRKAKIEAATTQPLHVSSSLPQQSIEALLSRLYELALKGNTAAAKLYIDHMTDEKPDISQLSPEDALKIIQEHLKNAA